MLLVYIAVNVQMFKMFKMFKNKQTKKLCEVLLQFKIKPSKLSKIKNILWNITATIKMIENTFIPLI